MDPGWIVAAVSLATALAAVAAWAARGAWKLGRRTWRFIEDWEGTPAVHGSPARPGVLDRLASLESGVSGISAQVHLNSGHSMKDVVTRTEAAVEDLSHRFDDLARQVGGSP